MTNKDVAVKVISKYLKKGNMAMCLRDILPASGLSLTERENVADIAHDVVRWKKTYDCVIEERRLTKNAEAYVKLATEVNQSDLCFDQFELKYSCSSYVASLLKNKLEWVTYLNEKPPTTLCVNFNKSSTDGVIHMLELEKMPAEKSNLETAVLTSSIGRYSSAVKEKYAHVQDESSQLVSFIALSLGDSILDFCAGNGGKSLAMASISKNKKKIFAYDISPKKRQVLTGRLKEYSASVTVEDKPGNSLFDVVLVDAPCTGIGAARRNPEAKYVEGPGAFPQMQIDILKEAANKIKPGGCIVYTVCTFTPEETQEVIKKFLKESGFKTLKINNKSYNKYLEKTSEGVFTVIPKGDIFFISILKK